MNPLEQQDPPTGHKKNRLEYHHLLSYTGLVITSFYVVLAINIAIQDQHNFRTGCIVTCLNGLLTSLMVAPAFLFPDLLGVKGFDGRDWSQVRPAIAFTALFIYIVVTGLEKLVCYLITRQRGSKPEPNRSE